MRLNWLAVLFLIYAPMLCAKNLHPAVTTPLQPKQLVNYDQYPSPVKHLIENATILSKKNLTYLFGSANPQNKGMDCSGTIYYLLHSLNISSTPRSSAEIYQWVKGRGKFYSVKDNASAFKYLRPGDLLFWTGTYASARTNSVSHVMVYLGKNKEGRPLMFGSSDGRTYAGRQMWGVSVFDFNMPRPGSRARFIGYSCIPELTCE